MIQSDAQKDTNERCQLKAAHCTKHCIVSLIISNSICRATAMAVLEADCEVAAVLSSHGSESQAKITTSGDHFGLGGFGVHKVTPNRMPLFGLIPLPLSEFLLLTLSKRGPGQVDQKPATGNSNITSQRPRTRQLYFQSLIIFRSFDLRHIVVFRSRKNHKPIVCPGHPEKHNL